ncbi:hypothetical protein [Mycolicibacterium chitae]|uniref:hypothetical protein n=1 Tax=Mycolicibacterium chitae TaxID=1792 RepID=UPI000F83A25E|nr:hypothetical protein [Mycolicibacterium chitae]MCV7109317.1 hypothetical protein [Mycolicibacterium chitae]
MGLFSHEEFPGAADGVVVSAVRSFHRVIAGGVRINAVRVPIDYDNPLEERLTELTASGQSAAARPDGLHLGRGSPAPRSDQAEG